MKHSLLTILTVIILVVTPFSLPGQPAGKVYDDVVLYYRLVEAERREGIYEKAYREFQHSDLADISLTRYDNKTARELAVLSREFTDAFWVERNYDRAFYISFQMEEKLTQVSGSDYPDKRKDYFKLGEAYYLFLDNHKSIELLEKALNPVPSSFADHTHLDALKIIGICYANIGRWEQSDEYFRATLLSDNVVLNRPLYNAYALSHLSCNAMLTGRYDKALALSAVAWPTLRQTDDYGHLAGMCYCRGRSHLEKGEFRQASAWVDSLVYFARKDQYNQPKRIKQAYQLQADYFTVMGDARQAKIYSDSLIAVYKAQEQLFTSQYISRAAEDYHSDKIAAQVGALKTSRTRILVISAVALLSIAAAGIVASLYRKKNAAYKALALRAEEWARSPALAEQAFPPETDGDGAREPATDEDRRIMALLEGEMTVNHAYRQPGLTAEALAERLGVHRNTLSRAINRTTEGNFNKYINTFRIREAVRIISKSERKETYIEELYERVGFSNRSTFSRTFKLFTGLSPSELQKQTEGTRGKKEIR